MYLHAVDQNLEFRPKYAVSKECWKVNTPFRVLRWIFEGFRVIFSQSMFVEGSSEEKQLLLFVEDDNFQHSFVGGAIRIVPTRCFDENHFLDVLTFNQALLKDCLFFFSVKISENFRKFQKISENSQIPANLNRFCQHLTIFVKFRENPSNSVRKMTNL